MSAVDLVCRLRDAGVILEARGDRLHVAAPPEIVTPAFRQMLAERKADLLAWVSIQARLQKLSARMGIPAAVVEALSVEELDATAEQVGMCEGSMDGHGDPLAQSLLMFYLRCLAEKAVE